MGGGKGGMSKIIITIGFHGKERKKILPGLCVVC